MDDLCLGKNDISENEFKALIMFRSGGVGSVGIHAPVARTLLYIVRASPSFLLHRSFETLYRAFH